MDMESTVSPKIIWKKELLEAHWTKRTVWVSIVFWVDRAQAEADVSRSKRLRLLWRDEGRHYLTGLRRRCASNVGLAPLATRTRQGKSCAISTSTPTLATLESANPKLSLVNGGQRTWWSFSIEGSHVISHRRNRA